MSCSQTSRSLESCNLNSSPQTTANHDPATGSAFHDRALEIVSQSVQYTGVLLMGAAAIAPLFERPLDTLGPIDNPRELVFGAAVIAVGKIMSLVKSVMDPLRWPTKQN